MEARANDINILENYKAANPEERFEIMFAHYSFFPNCDKKMNEFVTVSERRNVTAHGIFNRNKYW